MVIASQSIVDSSKVKPAIVTDRWLKSASLSQRNLYQYPNRYLVVRYESMVSDPEETITMVCDFLGIKYMPSMVQLDQIPRFRIRTESDQHTGSPLTSKFIGQFRQDLSYGQISFIEFFSRSPMIKFQYPMVDSLGNGNQRKSEILKIWLLNLIQMLGWRVLKQIERI